MVAWLPERFRGFATYRILIFGVALVVMMIFRPQGLLPSRRRQAEIVDQDAGSGLSVALLPPSVEGDQ
jgi:branched-chain amino acid transport system permease protein